MNLVGLYYRVGRDRDRQIRHMKIPYETEKMWMLIFLMRQERYDTVYFSYVRDESNTRLNSKFRARPRGDRESRCFFFRPK